MKNLCLPLLLIFVQNSFAQSRKVYLTKSGKFTNDPKKAIEYALIEKQEDTAYMVSKFDMDDFMTSKGWFKDSLLKIPIGKFYFYQKVHPLSSNKATLVDINEQPFTVGYYINGLRQGQWMSYQAPGVKSELYNYKDGKIDGQYQKYDLKTGDVREEGNFVNEKKEGEWNFYYRGYVKPYFTSIFRRNEEVKIIFHNKSPKAPATFDKYLQTALDPYIDYLKSEEIIVKLSITNKGKIDSIIYVNKTLNQDLYDIVKAALLKSPSFQPGIADDNPVAQTFIYNFKYGSSINTNNDEQEQRRNHILMNHTNDIGRGLNDLGMGKTLTN